MVVGLRRERGCKAGHAGTLDPFATGLLLVLLGRATRLQRFLTALPKTYLATARLGWRSSTGDPDGELTGDGAAARVARAANRNGAPTGSDDLGGQGRRESGSTARRIAARRSRPPSATSRSTAPTCSGTTPRRARYEIECSSGTYVRTLIETLGDAYCSELRRTAIGPFGVGTQGSELSIDRVAELVPAVAEGVR